MSATVMHQPQSSVKARLPVSVTSDHGFYGGRDIDMVVETATIDAGARPFFVPAPVVNPAIYRATRRVTEPVLNSRRPDIDELLSMRPPVTTAVRTAAPRRPTTTATATPNNMGRSLTIALDTQDIDTFLRVADADNSSNNTAADNGSGNRTDTGSKDDNSATSDVNDVVATARAPIAVQLVTARPRASVGSYHNSNNNYAPTAMPTSSSVSSLAAARTDYSNSVRTGHHSTASLIAPHQRDHRDDIDEAAVLDAARRQLTPPTLRAKSPTAARLAGTQLHREIVYTGSNNLLPLSAYASMDIDELVAVGSDAEATVNSSAAAQVHSNSDGTAQALGAAAALRVAQLGLRERANSFHGVGHRHNLQHLHHRTHRPSVGARSKIHPDVRVIGGSGVPKSASAGHIGQLAGSGKNTASTVVDIDQLLQLSEEVERIPHRRHAVAAAAKVERPPSSVIDADFFMKIATASENGSTAYKSVLADPQYAISPAMSYLSRRDSGDDLACQRDIQTSITSVCSSTDAVDNGYSDQKTGTLARLRNPTLAETSTTPGSPISRVMVVNRATRDIDDLLRQCEVDASSLGRPDGTPARTKKQSGGRISAAFKHHQHQKSAAVRDERVAVPAVAATAVTEADKSSSHHFSGVLTQAMPTA